MQKRRNFHHLLLSLAGATLALSSFCAAQTPPQTSDQAWATLPALLERIKAPQFPNRTFDITKYGAVADGKTDTTDAFRQAIEACNQAGGGRVVVPPGEFLTGAIRLKSNVNLYVSKDATIKFVFDTKKYPLVFTRWEGTELMNFSPFIYAFEEKNIAITGEGTLDGQSNSQTWWKWNGKKVYGWSEGMPNQKDDRDKLHEMSDAGVPVEQRVFGEGHYLRPQFIEPYRCQNVLIEGVKIINSPMWEIHPVLCQNVTVNKVWISSHGPNNDGCDPESCRDILIKDCYFETGDDCIAIKSGRNADGRRLKTPTEDIIIEGCTMKDGHGGITVGSEISGGVRNLFAQNCQMDSPNLDHALRVKNNASRGGLLENFYVRNLSVGQVAHALITVDFNYEEGKKGGFTPVMRNFFVENLHSGKSKYAVDVQGFDFAPITGLHISDSVFDNVAEGSIIANLQDVTLKNVKINGVLVDKLASK